ncbi:MAG: hypothetical protein ACE14P_14260 [Methanotrichaceae archaeon]
MKLLIMMVLILSLISNAVATTFSANEVKMTLDITKGTQSETKSHSVSQVYLKDTGSSGGLTQNDFNINTYDPTKPLHVALTSDYAGISGHYNYDNNGVFTAQTSFSELSDSSLGVVINEAYTQATLDGQGVLSLFARSQEGDGGIAKAKQDAIYSSCDGSATFTTEADISKPDSTDGASSNTPKPIYLAGVSASTSGFGYLSADQGATTLNDDINGAAASQNAYATTKDDTAYVDVLSQDPNGATEVTATVTGGDHIGKIGTSLNPVYQIAAAGENTGNSESMTINSLDLPSPSMFTLTTQSGGSLGSHTFNWPGGVSGSVAAGFYETAKIIDDDLSSVKDTWPYGLKLLRGDTVDVTAYIENSQWSDGTEQGISIVSPFELSGSASLGTYSYAYQGTVDGSHYGAGAFATPATGNYVAWD